MNSSLKIKSPWTLCNFGNIFTVCMCVRDCSGKPGPQGHAQKNNIRSGREDAAHQGQRVMLPVSAGLVTWLRKYFESGYRL